MSIDIDEILGREVADTLEKLAFIFAYPGEAAEDETDDGVSVRIDFRGLFGGTLAMRIAATALPELTTNMLGLDDGEPVTLAQQHDALREALNIICGNVLPAIAGRTAVFDLDPPVIPDPDAGRPTGRLAGHASLALDDGQLDVWLHVDESAEAVWLQTTDE